MLFSKKFSKYIFLYLLFNSQYNFAISYASIISRFWKKNEQEIIKKEYKVSSESIILLNNIKGNIDIKGWNQNKVELIAKKNGTQEELKNTDIQIKPSSKEIAISTEIVKEKKPASIDYTIMVPEKSNVKIRSTEKSNVKIKRVKGPIDIIVNNGEIKIYDTTKSINAKITNGPIKVKQKKFTDQNSIFLESLKGNINLYIPHITNANLHASVQKGNITSDHTITLHPIPMKLNKSEWEKIKKEIRGKLGSGGAPITIVALQGNVLISEL